MNFPPLKNDLFLRALKGEEVERAPVWMMRQAGRFLPDYRVLREKYTFFERCKTPELVSEITTMPIWQVGTDAAILFSDILVVPEALGLEVQMIPGQGPFLPKTINSLEDAEALVIPDVHEALGYVMDGIKQTRMDLKGEVPLIGFAGAPFTILCYMVQGKGSKDFSQAKSFCFNNPEAAHVLLQKITETTIAYMEAQVEAGAQAFQLFDSWAGLLSKDAFMEFAYPYIKQIMAKCTVPNIIFAKGAWYALKEMAELNVNGVGIDWACSPAYAREQVGDKITLQGNFDPSMLHAPIPTIEKETKKMLKAFGKQNYIVNLGHGILPTVPVENAKAFINTIKTFEY
ncbi:MAG: uroporphyrinogen decarboxylase [Flavobacteriales bacterium]|jgi:uroporphyrinogen decarboxylase|nr:uroporphyrinogen decarboxylase [Flavobacteriales bacterium]